MRWNNQIEAYGWIDIGFLRPSGARGSRGSMHPGLPRFAGSPGATIASALPGRPCKLPLAQAERAVATRCDCRGLPGRHVNLPTTIQPSEPGRNRKGCSPLRAYLAVSSKRCSRMTVTLMVPGYWSSSSMRRRMRRARKAASGSERLSGETMTRISRPAWIA